MRKTSVNIDKELENSIPEEVLQAVDNLVELAVEQNIPRKVISDLIAQKRRKLEYKEGVEALPEEEDRVKEFRAKLDKFFDNLEIHPTDLKQFIWDYEMWYANYHIELPVAAYQLYLKGEELSEDNIFRQAKTKMNPTDEFYRIRRKKYTGNWRTSKMMNLRRFQVYFNQLCDIRISKFFVEKQLSKFLADKTYSRTSLPWLKLIFLVENYY